MEWRFYFFHERNRPVSAPGLSFLTIVCVTAGEPVVGFRWSIMLHYRGELVFDYPLDAQFSNSGIRFAAGSSCSCQTLIIPSHFFRSGFPTMLSFRILLVILLITLAVSFRHKTKHSVSENPTAVSDRTHSWDYLLYVARWAGTVSEGKRLPSYIDSWTLHGIWPQRLDGSWPSFCSRDEFNKTVILDLYMELETAWYDYRGDGYQFWKHEWDKHGTCAETDPLIGNERGFFQTAINLHKQMAVKKMLTSKGIVPSDTQQYQTADIKRDIKSLFGVNAVLGCSKSHMGNSINDLLFCFDNTLKLMECPSNAKQGKPYKHRSGSFDLHRQLVSYMETILLFPESASPASSVMLMNLDISYNNGLCGGIYIKDDIDLIHFDNVTGVYNAASTYGGEQLGASE
ncbi:hypothetical protein PROFUN_10970 [Planoprotostelium fungivorum]|uniref:Uncharacterized protein n=1 Tax=Planoprotostelium fungivorum TaxID=1890364 RepID=A0A2P6NBW8_9EUKA|nr:hypothetical protein PROFUN_10970 [Planoprotostelium fungivorum]